MGTAIPVAPKVATALAEYRRGLEALYGERLSRVILFGSRARGEARPDSDIDVVVVLRGDLDVGEEIERTSYLHQEICLEHELVVGPIFLSERDFQERRSPLLGNIRREGIEY